MFVLNVLLNNGDFLNKNILLISLNKQYFFYNRFNYLLFILTTKLVKAKNNFDIKIVTVQNAIIYGYI